MINLLFVPLPRLVVLFACFLIKSLRSGCPSIHIKCGKTVFASLSAGFKTWQTHRWNDSSFSLKESIYHVKNSD